MLRPVDVYETGHEMAKAHAGLAVGRGFDEEVRGAETRMEIDYSGYSIVSARVQ